MRTTLLLEPLGSMRTSLGALYRLKRLSRLLGVEGFFGDLLPDGRKLFGGNDCRGVFATLDLTLVGMLEGGADGDDPAQS